MKNSCLNCHWRNGKECCNPILTIPDNAIELSPQYLFEETDTLNAIKETKIVGKLAVMVGKWLQSVLKQKADVMKLIQENADELLNILNEEVAEAVVSSLIKTFDRMSGEAVKLELDEKESLMDIYCSRYE